MVGNTAVPPRNTIALGQHQRERPRQNLRRQLFALIVPELAKSGI
jgi:hypothetical protein